MKRRALCEVGSCSMDQSVLTLLCSAWTCAGVLSVSSWSWRKRESTNNWQRRISIWMSLLLMFGLHMLVFCARIIWLWYLYLYVTCVQALKEYCRLIDSSSSFRAYRQVLAKAEPPCIPYMFVLFSWRNKNMSVIWTIFVCSLLSFCTSLSNYFTVFIPCRRIVLSLAVQLKPCLLELEINMFLLFLS